MRKLVNDFKTGKLSKYDLPKECTIYTQHVTDELVEKVRKTILEYGIAYISFSVTGRTEHARRGRELFQKMKDGIKDGTLVMPDIDSVIWYESYTCIFYEKE